MTSILGVLTGEDAVHVEQADVYEALLDLPDECFDFVLGDVPYGIGSKEPTPEMILAYLQGASLNTGDFMQKPWEIPSIAIWKEICRTCKPGAHVFSFGGRRTFDLISLGMRFGGLSFRDTIADEHPTVKWVYGQGAALGTGLDKSIDKLAGADREVVGTRVLQGTAALSCADKGGTFASGGLSGAGLSKEVPVTVPATDEAKEWEDWHANLKPCWEPILVARRPLDGNLTKNVLLHRTGGLNIGATRVQGPVTDPDKQNAKGRYTPNFVMEHAPGCVRVGTKQVRAINGGTGEASQNASGMFDVRHPASGGYGDANGEETIDEYECQPGCAVAAFNLQAGLRKSGARAAGARNVGMGYRGAKGDGGPAIESSEGAASRFYPCFEQDSAEPTFYASKAASTERDSGVEHMLWVKADNSVGWRRVDQAEWDVAPANKRTTGNIHVAVKPMELLRFLARLGVRKGGLALVPYAGVWSEVIALALEGVRVIGIEREPVFNEIGRARLRWWLDHPGGRTSLVKKQIVLEQAGQVPLFDPDKETDL